MDFLIGRNLLLFADFFDFALDVEGIKGNFDIFERPGSFLGSRYGRDGMSPANPLLFRKSCFVLAEVDDGDREEDIFDFMNDFERACLDLIGFFRREFLGRGMGPFLLLVKRLCGRILDIRGGMGVAGIFANKGTISTVPSLLTTGRKCACGASDIFIVFGFAFAGVRCTIGIVPAGMSNALVAVGVSLLGSILKLFSSSRLKGTILTGTLVAGGTLGINGKFVVIAVGTYRPLGHGKFGGEFRTADVFGTFRANLFDPIVLEFLGGTTGRLGGIDTLFIGFPGEVGTTGLKAEVGAFGLMAKGGALGAWGTIA